MTSEDLEILDVELLEDMDEDADCFKSYKVYDGVMRGKVKLHKPLERRLVIDVEATDISEEQMETMLADIQAKKKYKHDLLNYFVGLLEDNRDSQHLHQEKQIGSDHQQSALWSRNKI